jgi:hypothetical protein
MIAIGGKSKKIKPSKPQVVIQRGQGVNEFALFGTDDKQNATLSWVGDPNAASKFDSKYNAKLRTREIADVPESRVFHILN